MIFVLFLSVNVHKMAKIVKSYVNSMPAQKKTLKSPNIVRLFLRTLLIADKI